MPLGVRRATNRCLECGHRTLRIFCNLDDAAFQAFDQIGSHMNLPGRSIVFEESQTANGVYVVCSGQLKLSAMSKDGRMMILRIAGPGDVLGLSATLSDVPHEVTAETLEPTQLKHIRRVEFLQFLEDHAAVGEKAARTLAKEYQAVFLDAAV